MEDLLGRRITWTLTETTDRPTRTGVVWSAGPVQGTAWVVPDEPQDGEGHAVCVRIAPSGHEQRSIDLRRSTAVAQRDALDSLRHRWPVPMGFAGSHSEYGIKMQPMGYGLDRGLKPVRCRVA